MHAPLGSKTLGAFYIGSQPSDRAACEAAQGHAPCQFVRKKNLIFFAISLDLTAQDAILYSMKIKVRKIHGIFSKARPHKRVNKVLPRKEKHKKSVDLS